MIKHRRSWSFGERGCGVGWWKWAQCGEGVSISGCGGDVHVVEQLGDRVVELSGHERALRNICAGAVCYDAARSKQ